MLEHIATLFAEHLISADVDQAAARDTLLEAFLAREKLGSTALGDGIAIPHCRAANCKTPEVAVLTLTQGVDYDARDQQAVDTFFALIVPEEATQTHLEILASIVGLFQQAGFADYIRQATSSTEVYQKIVAQ